MAVRARSLDVQETSVGLEADPPECGEIMEPSADTEVPGVVDGHFCAERLAQLVILLDLGVLVVDVERRGDAFGDDPGAKAPRGRPVDPPLEDQGDLIGTAQIEIVTDYLLEEHPSGQVVGRAPG